uniref:Inter-alpha-trypsin inhibitor heavy chain 3b, tandem duplicate 1 n=1 Tax=Myripristis murdjan TaxID=586833 RepID=A0A667YEB8_9TELE
MSVCACACGLVYGGGGGVSICVPVCLCGSEGAFMCVVLHANEGVGEKEGGNRKVIEDWDIYSFHINSTVTSRYAITVITSRVVNRMDEPKEIEFHVRIPKNAFISKFRMLIDGQMYDGIVKAKEEAQQQYNEAVSRGQSAGLVSSVGRTLEEFKTSVTVAALQKVTFELTYEELLIRRLGKYELQIHARPMQPVKDFKVMCERYIPSPLQRKCPQKTGTLWRTKIGVD